MLRLFLISKFNSPECSIQRPFCHRQLELIIYSLLFVFFSQFCSYLLLYHIITINGILTKLYKRYIYSSLSIEERKRMNERIRILFSKHYFLKLLYSFRKLAILQWDTQVSNNTSILIEKHS